MSKENESKEPDSKKYLLIDVEGCAPLPRELSLHSAIKSLSEPVFVDLNEDIGKSIQKAVENYHDITKKIGNMRTSAAHVNLKDNSPITDLLIDDRRLDQTKFNKEAIRILSWPEISDFNQQIARKIESLRNDSVEDIDSKNKPKL